MMFFISWVVFLLVVILAVPIVAWLEKRKMESAYGVPDDEPADFGDMDEQEMAESDSDEPVEVAEAEAEFGEADEGFGGDDFAEFEEIR